MKNVIVTGASRGLGLALARRLLAEGYRVIAAVRASTPELDRLREGGRLEIEQFDASQPDVFHQWTRGVEKKYGRIFGLVNNAAIGADGVLGTMHERDIARTLLVNLHAPIVLTKYVSRSMLLLGEGRIVNITSIIANTGFSGLSVYAATKGGLAAFTRSLARELGKTGITVNSVAPGYMETEMTKEISPEQMESIRRRSPSRKLVGVDDAAGAVAFLMGIDGRTINGTTITVDAGSTA